MLWGSVLALIATIARAELALLEPAQAFVMSARLENPERGRVHVQIH